MQNRAAWACLAAPVVGGCDCYQAHDGDDDDVVGEDAGVDPDGGGNRGCEDEDGAVALQPGRRVERRAGMVEEHR